VGVESLRTYITPNCMSVEDCGFGPG